MRDDTGRGVKECHAMMVPNLESQKRFLLISPPCWGSEEKKASSHEGRSEVDEEEEGDPKLARYDKGQLL